MNDETKLSKIKALLAKAESTDSEAEAEALQAKAFEMIARYGLEEALAASERSDESKAERQTFLIEGTYHQRRRRLLTGLLRALRCKPLLVVAKGRQKNTMVLGYGMPADLERAKLLFDSLDLQLASALRRSLVNKPDWVHGRTWSVNFIDGFADTIRERVMAAEAQVENYEAAFGGNRFAPVLASNVQKVEALFEQENPRTVKVHMAGTKNHSGLSAGWSAGERANLGGSSNQVGSGRLALNR